jgi:hypothetical protein
MGTGYAVNRGQATLVKWGQATQSPISSMVGQNWQSPNLVHVLRNEIVASR